LQTKTDDIRTDADPVKNCVSLLSTWQKCMIITPESMDICPCKWGKDSDEKMTAVSLS